MAKAKSKPWKNAGNVLGFIPLEMHHDETMPDEAKLKLISQLSSIIFNLSVDQFVDLAALKEHWQNGADNDERERIGAICDEWEKEQQTLGDIAVSLSIFDRDGNATKADYGYLCYLSFIAGMLSVTGKLRFLEHQTAVGKNTKKAAKAGSKAITAAALARQPLDSEIQKRLEANRLICQGETRAKEATAKSFNKSVRTLDKWLKNPKKKSRK